MKALEIYEWGKVALKDVPIPKVGKNQLLIKTAYAAVNPADLMNIQGLYPSGIKCPGVAGMEGSGVIVEVGEELKVPHKIGDTVGFAVGCGAYAEYVVVDSLSASPVSSENSVLEAATQFVNPCTVYCMMALLKKNGKNSVIHTAGGSALGKMLIKACKSQGIKSINVVRNKKYFAEMTELGSDCNLDMTDPDFQKNLEKAAKEFNATVCFEAVAGDLTNKCSNAMPNGSTIYIYGALQGGFVKDISVGDLIFRKQTITGFWLGTELTKFTPNDFMAMGQDVQKNLKTVYKTEVKVFDACDFEKAFEHTTKNSSEGKAVLKFN